MGIAFGNAGPVTRRLYWAELRSVRGSAATYSRPARVALQPPQARHGDGKGPGDRQQGNTNRHYHRLHP